MVMQRVDPATTRIGWIGTGVMGAPMCGHLVDRGFSVTVHNRTRSKADRLVGRGAAWAESPRQAAERCDVVFTMVGFPGEVREAVLGPRGVLAGAREGSVLVDMSTSEPSLAAEIAAEGGARGVRCLDAPVSGGDRGAREGTLSVMIGGDPEAAEALGPCWEALGTTVVHHGGPGAGQHAKMVNQTLVAGNMIGVCEALLYAHKAGLDLDAVMRSVASGAAGSWSLSNLGPRILANDFDPGFYVEHFIKDMGIALEEACRMGLALPGLALARQLYLAVEAQGHGRKGTHALQLALASLSGIDWVQR